MPDNEAPKSLDDVLERRRQEIADQKDPTRLQDPKRAKFASLKFGRPELVDEDGSVMVTGMPATSKGLVARDDVRQRLVTPAPPSSGQTTSSQNSTTQVASTEIAEPPGSQTEARDFQESPDRQTLAEPTDDIDEFFDQYFTTPPAAEFATLEDAVQSPPEDSSVTFPWETSSVVEYPDGTTRLFEHDDNGLFRVTNPDGTVLQKCLDESWIELDANGNLTGNSFPVHSVDLDAIGDFTHQKADGSMLEHWSDGTIIETDVAGVSVTTNPDGSRAMLHWGRAYLVTHPDGGTRSFDYDGDGNICKMQESQTGLCYEKKGDSWYKYLDVNEEGMTEENTLEEFTGSMQVDVTGRVRVDSPDKITTIYPDGRWVESYR